MSSVQVSVVLPALEAASHLALRLHHVLDHGQEGHLVLDALGQRQVALESAVQRLALLRALGHNHLGHLHLTSARMLRPPACIKSISTSTEVRAMIP